MASAAAYTCAAASKAKAQALAADYTPDDLAPDALMESSIAELRTQLQEVTAGVALTQGEVRSCKSTVNTAFQVTDRNACDERQRVDQLISGNSSLINANNLLQAKNAAQNHISIIENYGSITQLHTAVNGWQSAFNSERAVSKRLQARVEQLDAEINCERAFANSLQASIWELQQKVRAIAQSVSGMTGPGPAPEGYSVQQAGEEDWGEEQADEEGDIWSTDNEQESDEQ